MVSNGCSSKQAPRPLAMIRMFDGKSEVKGGEGHTTSRKDYVQISRL